MNLIKFSDIDLHLYIDLQDWYLFFQIPQTDVTAGIISS